MSKPVYELPMDDNEAWPPASARRAAASPFDDLLAPPAAPGASAGWESAPPPAFPSANGFDFAAPGTPAPTFGAVVHDLSSAQPPSWSTSPGPVAAADALFHSAAAPTNPSRVHDLGSAEPPAWPAPTVPVSSRRAAQAAIAQESPSFAFPAPAAAAPALPPQAAAAPPLAAPPLAAPPTQAIPVQAPPVHAAPLQAAPLQAPPLQAPPLQAPPLQAPPAAQQHAAPTQAASVQTPPVRTAAVQTASGLTAPPLTAPTQQLPQQTAPTQVLPQQAPPVQAPAQSYPAPATPALAPPPAAPAQSAPTSAPVTGSPAPGDGQPGNDPRIVAYLNAVVIAGASDLHVTAAAPPMLRVDGGLRPIPETPVWATDDLKAALYSIMTSSQIEIFEEKLELDFAYTLSTTARFRVNIYMQRQAVGAAFRLIPTEIKQLHELGVPDSVSQFANLPRGLVLITGPTGSGKSTTLAALIDLVNRTRADHIMTVEDPIEFIHGNHKSLVNQREVGHDTHSFGAALKHVLRQDPDVILVGELRDLETISVALTAAETGHLVFATLHTQDAPQTIDRMIDVFPPHQQGQVRTQLAATLQGVVCQTLVKRASGRGRVVATEVMLTTPAVANLIREGKTFQIATAMQAGGALGMHTMDQHLADLVNSGQITHQAALEKAKDVDAIARLVHRVDMSTKNSDSFDSDQAQYTDESLKGRH